MARLRLLPASSILATPTLVASMLMAPTLVRAADEGSSGPGSAETRVESIRDWVPKLDSDSFGEREQATKKLSAAGREAVLPVAEFAVTASRDAGWRSIEVLRAIYATGDRVTRTEADAALTQLAARKQTFSSRAATALQQERAHIIQRTSAEIRALGGTVFVQQVKGFDAVTARLQEEWRGGDEGVRLLGDMPKVTWLSLERSAASDAALLHVKELNALETLFLGQSQITGEGLPQLAGLNELTQLSLQGLKVGDAHLAALTGLSKLELLGLDDTQITDRGLTHVAKLKHLKVLWLNRTQVTDQGLAQLSVCTDLTKLYLSGTKAAGPGLAKLNSLSKLSFVSLQGAEVTDAAAVHLASLTQVETLGLDDTKIGDAALKSLKEMKSLQVLWLNNTAVTDDGLQELEGLDHLKTIYAKGTKITSEGEARMGRMRPDCQVIR